MSIRVTTEELKRIISTSVKENILRAQVEIASHLIDDVLGSSGLSAVRLKDIELYLAAHFTSIYSPSDGQVVELKMGETEEKYGAGESVLGEGLKLTTFGQQALALDTTGALAALGKRTALFSTFGYSPSAG